jgi:ABC-type uncharacterized transport system auxiliary subunit
MSATRVAGLVVAVGLAGCALLSRKAPPAIQYYEVAVQGTPASPLKAPLELAPFTSDQPYATERIAYRTSPYRIDYYVYNRWASDPRGMVAAATRDYLGRGAPRDGGSPLVLTAHIRRIEEVDDPSGARQGVLGLDVKIVQDGRVVLASSYDESEPAQAANVEAVVEALSRALGRILDRVGADLRKR